MRFYYHPSPNPLKVALLLEEAGLPLRVGAGGYAQGGAA